MKKRKLILFAIVIAASIFMMTATNSSGEVNVSINVPLPGLYISAPPVMAVMPGTSVYYPPEVSVDIFFYHGNWYRPYHQGWFISNSYNGPWRSVEVGHVPHSVINIPPGYRSVHPRYDRIAHDDMRRNWRSWERDRHWDRDEHRGRGHEEHGHDKHKKHGGEGREDRGGHGYWGR